MFILKEIAKCSLYVALFLFMIDSFLEHHVFAIMSVVILFISFISYAIDTFIKAHKETKGYNEIKNPV